MKTLHKYFLIGFMLCFTTPVIQAQTIDANRMNRDLRIMEGVLSEMFKMEPAITSPGRESVFARFSLRGNTVKGTYVPGYGAIFMIPQKTYVFPEFAEPGKPKDGSKMDFYYNSDKNTSDKKVDEESIKQRITEFLKNYAPTIGQLKDEENVIVIFGSKKMNSPVFGFYSVSGGQINDDTSEPLPIISISTTKSNLDAYRAGKLKDSAFNKKLSVSETENKEYLDLKVLCNIFETAFSESSPEAFRLSGGVDYLMLENFGAIYTMTIRFDPGHHFPPIIIQDQQLREAMQKRQINVLSNMDSASVEEAKAKKAEYDEKARTTYKELKNQLKDYLVDYGRTLSSINSDQYILATVNIEGNVDGIPERIDAQIKKSALQQLDKGSISREQALQSIALVEY